MTSFDPPRRTGRAADQSPGTNSSERPEGVIFLGESQWVLGNRPPTGGPLHTVLAVPPLRSTSAGNGVVSISFDMRLLAALP